MAYLEMKAGDEFNEKAFFAEEDINMDYVYQAIDSYNNAINYIKDHDFELQAIAHFKIGKIFYRGLKTPLKAKENFMATIRLANILFPKVVTGTTWYQLSVKMLQEIRDAEI